MANDIFQICQRLIPPILLSSPTRWKLAENEESVTNNAKLVVDWVEEEVPKALEMLLNAIEKEPMSLQTRAFIVITASRFISPRKKSLSVQSFSLNEWTNEERYLFTSRKNEDLARSVLQFFSEQTDNSLFLAGDLVEEILQSYIRPLYSTTNSGSINAASGRAKQESKLPKAGGGPMEEDTIWKGGDVKRAYGMQLLGQNVVSVNPEDPSPMQARHFGIASDSVFYVCCSSIASMTNGEDDAWDRYWTQILPPLLQLVEDPSPRFRLIGTQILNECLLVGHKEQKRRQKIGTLLLRTGVGQLIFSNLASSLTFISNRISGALLQSTSDAWIKLTNVMTSDIIVKPDNHQAYLQDDGGRGRYERLSQLVDEGILRVWAYAPSQSSSFDEEQSLQSNKDVLQNWEELECMDIIDSSIGVLIDLARKDALGTGIVRYLDVTFEFLIQQLLGIENKVMRAKQRSGQNAIINYLQREILAARAIYSILDVSQSCPVIENWCTRCITVSARCWVITAENQTTGSQQLQSTLHEIVALFVRAYPQRSKEVLNSISSLDPSLFAPFTKQHLN